MFPRLSGANRYEPRDLAPVSWSRRVCGRVGARWFFRSPDPTHCRDKTVGRELSTTRMSWLVASSLAAAAAVGRLEAPGAMEGPKSVNIQQVVTTERRGSRDRHVERPKSAIRSCRRFSYASKNQLAQHASAAKFVGREHFFELDSETICPSRLTDLLVIFRSPETISPPRSPPPPLSPQHASRRLKMGPP